MNEEKDQENQSDMRIQKEAQVPKFELRKPRIPRAYYFLPLFLTVYMYRYYQNKPLCMDTKWTSIWLINTKPRKFIFA